MTVILCSALRKQGHMLSYGRMTSLKLSKTIMIKMGHVDQLEYFQVTERSDTEQKTNSKSRKVNSWK